MSLSDRMRRNPWGYGLAHLVVSLLLIGSCGACVVGGVYVLAWLVRRWR